jgi:uncharacterized protein DUF1524/excalibur calcium-binding domain-containing protein
MPRTQLRRTLLGSAVLALLAGCAVPATSERPETRSHQESGDRTSAAGAGSRSTTSSGRHEEESALDQLATLEVKGRAPMTGYDRDRFGAAWLDADRNGCDTRNDILRRDLRRRAYDPHTHGCVVVSGLLHNPYTNSHIDFVKGDGSLVDIDHVVALGNAWVTGGFRWEIRKRAALANDPMNLLAVDASANRQKGDGDAATWLPSNKSYRCQYVARQIGVKAKYGLWVTPPEKDAMSRILTGCPDRPAVPDSGAPVLAPLRLSEPSESSGDGAGYGNCDEARADGAAPVRRGDPGYSTSLDGDGDGVACE